VPNEQEESRDYPIHIRDDDACLSLDGEVLITGPAAEKVRRLLLSRPEFYRESVVPFIQRREPSFQPSELWIDPAGRIHITNPSIVRRVGRHIAAHARGRRRGRENR